MAMIRRKKWYRLDSAARIFPSIVTNRMTTVFRISATCNEPISPSQLQHALDATIKEYPHFQVSLRQGLFWNYFQENRHAPVISEERFAPCRPMNRRHDRNFQFRVIYYSHRISLECSHVLSDGTGALIFLNTLLEKYNQQSVNCVSANENRVSANENRVSANENRVSAMDSRTIEPGVDPELWEDAYRRYYRPEIPAPRLALGAYHLPKRLLHDQSHRVITATLPCADLKNLAKQHGVTITEYLVSTWLAALQDLHAENPRRAKLLPLRVMVPVNLRTLYPSKTMRNFFLTVLPGIDLRLGHFTFREILDTVHHYMQVEVNGKYINQQIRQIVGNSAVPFVRFLPRIVKAPFERIIYRHIATRKHSGVFTNLGLIRLEHPDSPVRRFDFIPNPNPVTGCNVGVISFGEWTTITVSSLELYRDPERLFFTRLRRAGLALSIETNEKDH